MSLAAELDRTVAEQASLPAYLRGRPLSAYRRRHLDGAASILRERLRAIEAELAKRPPREDGPRL